MAHPELEIDWSAGTIDGEYLRIPGSDQTGQLVIIASQDSLMEGGQGRDDDYLARHGGFQGVVESAAGAAFAAGSIVEVDGERRLVIWPSHFPR